MARAGRGFPNRALIVRPAAAEPPKVGPAAETSTALPLTAAHAAALTAAAETGTALPMTPVITRPLAAATDTGTVLPMAAARTQPADRAQSTQTALPMTAVKTAVLGVAVETSTAFPITSTAQVNRLVEHDQALPVTAVKIGQLGRASAAGLAAPLTYARTAPTAAATESGTALAFTATKTGVLHRAVETGTARAMLRRRPPLQVGLPQRRWAVRFAGRRGSVDPVNSLSREHLEFAVDYANGSEPVEAAFTVPGVKPIESDWRPATWGEPTKKGMKALVLVGPGSSSPLPDGTYQAWIRVSRGDEVPVLPSGLVPIT
ncbi:hypothetical protein ACIBKY_50980 [Nonomuraea sp. NPDC050394]|uniref:hypothetical protein n=1 Tax=Nonomuraea sp. NPDC050394 TaxID=3364363 RepID=UPI0037AAE3B4